MASPPSQDQDLAEVFQKLTTAYNTFTSGPNVDIKAKAQLRSAAQELIAQLSTPHEAVMAFALGDSVHPCFRIAANCGIFANWTKDIMTAKELSEKTGADQRLIVRILRVLICNGIFKEVGEDTYTHSTLSKSLSAPTFLSTIKFMSPGIARLPEYLTLTSHRNPGTPSQTSTPYSYGNATPLTFYQSLAATPSARAGFDAQMRQHVLLERARTPTGFAALYDFGAEIAPLVESEEDVAIVDVGGSLGHVLQDVRKHVGGLKGRLVLQDLEATVEGKEELVGEGIEIMPYDFFAGVQPVKGAACYLFRQIFLNWNDTNGALILRNTLRALHPTRSRLLIMEPVLPATGAPLQAALMDVQMMQMSGGLRTEKQWRAFLDESGFEVRRFLKAGAGQGQTVIEAFVKGREG